MGGINPQKIENYLRYVQFVPHRERRILRLERQIGDRIVGTWLLIVRFEQKI
jgi:hypothetical protein